MRYPGEGEVWGPWCSACQEAREACDVYDLDGPTLSPCACERLAEEATTLQRELRTSLRAGLTLAQALSRIEGGE